MEPDRIISGGARFGIRPHTRFVDFPRHSHRYVEMVYQVRGGTRHIINGRAPLTLREGTDTALLSAGGILTQTVEAAKLLEAKGISAEVVSFLCVKPMDGEAVRKLTERFRHIVTVEEHNIMGGFGSAVCEIAAETGNGCRIHRIGLQDCYTSVVGSQQYLREIYGMDAKAIAEKTEAWLNEA